MHPANSGTLTGARYTGNLYVTMNGQKQTNMTFTLQAGRTCTRAHFSAWQSPKVFDKGWLFGAEFKITDNEGKETDLGDKIEWSGTATFWTINRHQQPARLQHHWRKQNHLTVNHDGKIQQRIHRINSRCNWHARVGSVSKCPADAHGGPCRPAHCRRRRDRQWQRTHQRIAAACEGDRGMQYVSCAGANTFVITVATTGYSSMEKSSQPRLWRNTTLWQFQGSPRQPEGFTPQGSPPSPAM